MKPLVITTLEDSFYAVTLEDNQTDHCVSLHLEEEGSGSTIHLSCTEVDKIQSWLSEWSINHHKG